MTGTGGGSAKPAAAIVTMIALGVLLAGCGGGDASQSDQANSTAGKSGSAAGKTVTVDETEYEISLSQTTFTPGTYTFTIADRGQTTHALEIDGPGVEDLKSDTVSPGASADLTVTLKKGTYEVYCPVDGHKDLGMDTKITVG
jgi:uncharacterized cupredoxin-like copper-binding protein